MSDIEKLKEVTLFHNLSEAMLSEFAGYFKRTDYAAGDVVFKEGTQGDSLYIIVDGEVIIEKSMDAEDREFKTLAILSAGDFFGEMAVMQDQVRFAQARASRESSLYEIGREKFFSFIKENPETGISIFSEIMRSLLKRLQHTSSELTMLFDLSGHLLATYKTPADFLSAVMEDLRHYFEGSWNVRAYVYNMFNEEYEQVYLRESFPQDKAACELPASPQSGCASSSPRRPSPGTRWPAAGSCAGFKTWACRSPWTTSGPATPPCAPWPSSPSTSSRLTARLWTRSRPTRGPATSCAPWSLWGSCWG